MDRDTHLILQYAFFHHTSARSLISIRWQQKCLIAFIKTKITATITKTRGNTQINQCQLQQLLELYQLLEH
jgi:hypothetical protein